MTGPGRSAAHPTLLGTWLALLGVALLLAAGCARQEAGGLGDDGGSVALPARQTNATVARQLTSKDRALLYLTEEKLVARCMGNKGFRYSATPIPTSELREASTPRWYGNDDEVVARQQGYGVSSGRRATALGVADRAQDPNARLVQRLPPADQQRYTEALFGRVQDYQQVALPNGKRMSVSVSGCVADARRQLYGDVREYLRLTHVVTNLGAEVYRLVVADSRYLHALDAWRGCMRQRGYGYDSPGAAVEAIGALAGASAASRAAARGTEVRVAVADARCAARSRLVAVANELDRKYDARVAHEQAGAILALQRLRAAALERAKALIPG
jgi:hypothetical protein